MQAVSAKHKGMSQFLRFPGKGGGSSDVSRRLVRSISVLTGHHHSRMKGPPPLATLILLLRLQSLDSEQKEAAEIDGANLFTSSLELKVHLYVAHQRAAWTLVVLNE